MASGAFVAANTITLLAEPLASELHAPPGVSAIPWGLIVVLSTPDVSRLELCRKPAARHLVRSSMHTISWDASLELLQ